MRQIVRYTILATCLASLAGCASFQPFGRTATPGAQQAGEQASAAQAAPQSPAQATQQQATPAPSQPAPQTALPPPPQTSLPPPQTAPSATPQTGNIEIVNRTQNAIDIVVAGECASSGQGSSILPSGQTIAPGASRAFPVAAGCWDVGVGVTNVGEARQRITVEAAGTVQYVIN